MTATRKKNAPTPQAPSFRQAYDVLHRHAETLRSQREPDIDDLLRIVTESVAAYKVCRERIDAVEAALEQALAGADDAGVAGDGPRQAAAGARGDEDDDDIGFDDDGPDDDDDPPR